MDGAVSETRTLSIDPERPVQEALEEAAAILRAGGLVAFATETVYGLGADATNEAAVARIFEAKGRPSSNPLIVHVSGREMARACVAEWPEAAERLATEFWPGPLSLVLPRSARIPDIVTAGLETVAVRVPAANVARRLVECTGRPIAAPSANRASGVSPTMAAHVLEDLNGAIDLILDSGRTALGLESTVVDLTPRHPHVLRPGPISLEDLRLVLSDLHVHEAIGLDEAGHSRSPGRQAVHYAPRTRAVRVDSAADLEDYPWPEAGSLIVVGDHDIPDVPDHIRRVDLGLPDLAAHDLYLVLRECDASGGQEIIIVPPPDRPEWHALRDRISRATEPARAAHPSGPIL
jgi:L-threonylcarbamoyladenylate synthase